MYAAAATSELLRKACLCVARNQQLVARRWSDVASQQADCTTDVGVIGGGVLV